MHIAKAQKISTNAGRLKATDYDDVTRELILSAANTYCALLVSQGAFLTSLEELELVKRACKRVNDNSEKNLMALIQSPYNSKAVNAMWFKNKRDEGVVYTDLFNPVSVHSIALILTVVKSIFYFQVSNDKYNRLNAISMSGFLAQRPKSPLG